MGGFSHTSFSKLISSLITCYVVLSSKNGHFWLKKQTNKTTTPKHVSDKKLKSSLVSEIIVDSWSDFVQSLSHSFVTPTNQVKFSFPRSTSGPSCTWKWFWRRAEQSPPLPRCAVGWHPLPQLYLHINTPTQVTVQETLCRYDRKQDDCLHRVCEWIWFGSLFLVSSAVVST